MEKVFKIDGMSCQHCVMAVKKEISKLPVDGFDVKIGEAKVQFNESNVKTEEIKKAIVSAGYIVLE
ncbi:MAG TPA: heavy-metal-associated domain-containing protein [Ignavibacteriaceae bacterium]|nr:heavy-metal-associated domain-containing protein [Ignavibacteriaceae bacterium]